MKLTKRQKKAVRALKRISDMMYDNEGDTISISYADASAIGDVFGWDVIGTTYRKKEVDTFVKGKEKVLLEICPRMNNSWAPNYHAYFPFQVKKHKC